MIRDYPKFPAGSVVEIKANGELWIADTKTYVVISKATEMVMRKEGIMDKKLTIGKSGYVIVKSCHAKKVHSVVAASKKNTDFLNLRETGFECRKDELEVLHLDDCPYNFNVENLHWNTHNANLLLKLSYGTPKKSKFRASTSINGKNESGTTCSTLLEARHGKLLIPDELHDFIVSYVVLLAVDILKINNVPDHLKNLVFNHGMNLKYPNIQTLVNCTRTSQPIKANPVKAAIKRRLSNMKVMHLLV